MKFRHLVGGIVVASTGLLSAAASAAPVISNLALSDISIFDAVITGTGATVGLAQVVNGVSIYNYIDKDGNPATVTVTRPDGSAASPSGTYSDNGQSLSGSRWDIGPSNSAGPGGGVGGKADIPGFNSGLKFTFSSPVNAFGLEIGDWATCCYNNTRPVAVQTDYGVPPTGSGLWIAFDGGAATLPANALTDNDNPGYAKNSSSTNFIGAIDSSGFFSTVTFFGDGFGEVLYAGGTLRFASVPKGSVGTDVSEPPTLAIAGLALITLLGLRRYRMI